MKFNVAIVSAGAHLDNILAAIDFDNINICALFGIQEDISAQVRKIFHKVLQPLDMLLSNCVTCGADYFLINVNNDIDARIYSKLIVHGIEKEKIIIMKYFGSKPQFNYAYFIQWRYLIDSKPKLDFIVTGSSYVREGFDLVTR